MFPKRNISSFFFFIRFSVWRLPSATHRSIGLISIQNVSLLEHTMVFCHCNGSLTMYLYSHIVSQPVSHTFSQLLEYVLLGTNMFNTMHTSSICRVERLLGVLSVYRVNWCGEAATKRYSQPTHTDTHVYMLEVCNTSLWYLQFSNDIEHRYRQWLLMDAEMNPSVRTLKSFIIYCYYSRYAIQIFHAMNI